MWTTQLTGADTIDPDESPTSVERDLGNGRVERGVHERRSLIVVAAQQHGHAVHDGVIGPSLDAHGSGNGNGPKRDTCLFPTRRLRKVLESVALSPRHHQPSPTHANTPHHQHMTVAYLVRVHRQHVAVDTRHPVKEGAQVMAPVACAGHTSTKE